VTDDVVNDILAHHGIMGMHWGARKAETGAKQYAPKKTKLPAGAKPISSVSVKGKKIAVPKGTHAVYDFYTKHQRVICFSLLAASILTRTIIRLSTGLDVPIPMPSSSGMGMDKTLPFLSASDADENALYHADDDAYELSEEVVAMLDSLGLEHSEDSMNALFASYGIEPPTSDVLEHFGIMGMHWGIRKDSGMKRSVKRGLSKLDTGDQYVNYIEEYDQKWLQKLKKNPKLGLIGKRAAREATKQTRKLKKEYKALGLNIKKDKLARSRYDRDLKVVLEGAMETAANKTYGFSPSRILEVTVIRNSDWSLSAVEQTRSNPKLVKQWAKIRVASVKRTNKRIKATKREAKDLIEVNAKPDAVRHSEDAEGTVDDFNDMVFNVSLDSEGFLDTVTMVGEDLAQSDLVDSIFASFGIEDERLPQEVTDILSHHGILGMHWGHRKSTVKSVNKSITKTADKLHKTEEHAISDAELKARVNRIEMERKYAALTAPQKSAGQKIVHDLIIKLAVGVVTMVVNKMVSDALTKRAAGGAADSAMKTAAKAEAASRVSAKAIPKLSTPSYSTPSHSTPFRSTPSHFSPFSPTSSYTPQRNSYVPQHGSYVPRHGSYGRKASPINIGFVPASPYKPGHTYQQPNVVKRLLITSK